MIAFEIRFLAGHSHTTSWTRHAHDVADEWPPAPCWILRALAAAWAQGRLPGVSREQVKRALSHLRGVPEYRLATASRGRMCHNTPPRKSRNDDSLRLLDSPAAPDRLGPVAVIWPDACPGEADRALLGRLAASVPCLGRTRSWCELQLLAQAPAGGCVERPSRSATAASQETFVPLVAIDGKVSLDDLVLDTTDKRRRGQQLIRSTTFIPYDVPQETQFLNHHPARHAHAHRLVDLARFALDASTLPSVVFSLYLAEDARRALMSLAREPSACLSGRNTAGTRLSGHRHAFFLPEDADGDGRIDHLTVHAPGGFDERACDALAAFRTLARHGRGRNLRLMLLYLGPRDVLPSAAAGCAGRARLWRSATPFVLIRHPKRNGKDMPADQLRLELERRGLPEPDHVVFESRLQRGGASIPWLQFRRRRDSTPPLVRSRALRTCFGFALRFSEPVRGPIALGYASHFGLGLFRPADRERRSLFRPEE